MKKLVALTALSLSFASASIFAETFKGVVTDASCSKDTAKAVDPLHADCARSCIKNGEMAVLVVGDKVFKIANQPMVIEFAGKSVTIKGTMKDNTITVASIKE